MVHDTHTRRRTRRVNKPKSGSGDVSCSVDRHIKLMVVTCEYFGRCLLCRVSKISSARYNSVAIIGDAVSRLEPEMIPLSIYLSNLTFFNLPRPATATTTTTAAATA